jgi:hypothetical protein
VVGTLKEDQRFIPARTTVRRGAFPRVWGYLSAVHTAGLSKPL